MVQYVFILDALMSALSRVLREDRKKNMELITNIVHIFYCFSNYTQYHPIITGKKVGDLCIKILEQELMRQELWLNDTKNLKKNGFFK